MAKEEDDKLKDDRPDNDVLGIAGSEVPKEPGDPTTEYDPDSVAQRRARMRRGAEESTTSEGPEQHSGATGIDMGAGGQGTQIKHD